MYNVIISALAGIAVTLLIGFGLGGGELKIWYGILPGLIAFFAAYIFLARRILKLVQAAVAQAQTELSKQRVSQAIAVLKQAYPLGKWQFFIASQIDAQIGSILYMTQKFDESEPYLKRSFKKNWVSRAMLAALYYKRKKYTEMEKVFDEAVKANKKESLLWNMYAYCMWKAGDRDKAIAVLNRALEAMPEDAKSQTNLNALKNNKKMKMRSWNLMWYQFHLDKPPAQRQNAQFRRR
ncbi:MAG: tetratricopeptide repeat protein [Bradymonadaceae bacterium]|nr:tetratricopeptide repeat protein [Lujinxingiaceae bacterium]